MFVHCFCICHRTLKMLMKISRCGYDRTDCRFNWNVLYLLNEVVYVGPLVRFESWNACYVVLNYSYCGHNNFAVVVVGLWKVPFFSCIFTGHVLLGFYLEHFTVVSLMRCYFTRHVVFGVLKLGFNIYARYIILFLLKHSFGGT